MRAIHRNNKLIIRKKVWKHLVQALAPVSADGMEYGTFSTGGSVGSGIDDGGNYIVPRIVKTYLPPVPEVPYVAPVSLPPELPAYLTQFSTPTDLQVSNDLQPIIQFIDVNEFVALSNEGIEIPANANVVIVPVSSQNEPEIFAAIVEAQIAQPSKPIFDVVIDVIAPIQQTAPAEAQAIKEDVLFSQAVIEVKQQNPEVTIAEALKTVTESQEKPVTFIDPVLTQVSNPIAVKEEPLATIVNANESLAPSETSVSPVIETIKEAISDPKLTSGETKELAAALGLRELTTEEKLAKDKNGLYIAGAVVVLGLLALMFKN